MTTEEQELKRENIRSKKIDNAIKVLAVVGSIITFLWITFPKHSADMDKRRQDNLASILNEKDLQKRKVLLHEFFPEVNPKTFEQIREQVKDNTSIALITEMNLLYERKNKQIESLKKEFDNSCNDIEKKIIRNNINFLEIEKQEIGKFLGDIE